LVVKYSSKGDLLTSLFNRFPNTGNSGGIVVCCEWSWGWSFVWRRNLFLWEMDSLNSLKIELEGFSASEEEDVVAEGGGWWDFYG